MNHMYQTTRNITVLFPLLSSAIMAPTITTIKQTIGSVCTNMALRREIDNRVEIVSQIMNLGSLRLDCHVKHAYHNGLELPRLKNGTHATKELKHHLQPYPTRSPGGNWSHPGVPGAVHDVFDNIDFPQLRRVDGFSRHLALAANRLAVNIVVMAEKNTEIYIGHTISSFMMSIGLKPSKSHPLYIDLMKCIKDPTEVLTFNIPQVHQQARDNFLNYHRNYLNTHSIDLQGSLSDQHEKILLYFAHLLNYQDTVQLPDGKEPKRFHVVPIHDVKRMHIDIDAEILFYLLRDAKPHGFPFFDLHGNQMTAARFRAAGLVNEWTRKMFNVSQHESDRRKFKKLLTNGVAISTVYELDENIEPGPAQVRPRHLRGLASKLYTT